MKAYSKPAASHSVNVGSTSRIKTKNARNNPFKRLNILALASIMIIAAAVLAVPVYSVRSSSLPIGSSQANVPAEASQLSLLPDSNSLAQWSSPTFRSVLPAPTPTPESIETFAADCTTPKSSFVLGETVCAKTDNVDLNYPGGRWVHWLRDDLSIAHGGSGTTPITTNPQTFSFAPDAVGTWKATIAETGDDSQTPADFTVSSTPLATYESGCLQADWSFSLGDTVCARVAVDPSLNRRLFWIDPAGNLRAATPVTSNPQTDLFTLPGTETSIVGDSVVDNRGTWKVNIVSSRGSVVYSVLFSVSGTTATADLGVSKSIIGESPDPGAQFTYFVAVTNYGPSNAANVVFTDPQPVNATFDSIIQTSGPTSPAFNCDGNNPVVCTRATLAAGAIATFEITYRAGAAGASITNTANVSSDTAELNNADNTTSYGPVIVNGTPGGGDPTCSLGCPGDQTVTATSSSGAVVNFSDDVEVSGTCGTITFNPASGSQFAVGTTPVTVTSSEGDGSCTFNVNVINRPAPDIQCPLPTLTEEADAGETETTVNVPTPSATGENLTVSGVRDDDREINDPYPVGTTVITWTATDDNGTQTVSDDRTDSCSQTVNVTSPQGDAPTITCRSNKTFTINDCTSYTATAAEIETPTTTGNGVTVESARSDGLPLLDPYPIGTTTITWTATDNVGRVVSCTQLITVNSTGDSTPPTLTVPPNVSATTSSCSATLDDELGVATAEDACSTVTISRSGVPTFSCPTPQNPNRQCESFVFPTGTTVITYTATDGSGNTTTGTQTVTVTEDPAVPPTITAPADASYQCASEVPAASPSQATAADNCGTPVVTVSETNNGGAGSPASPLVITRTYTATDASGNSASDSQTITVIDNTPPTVTAPADSSASADASCQAPVPNYVAGSIAADNCDSTVTVTQSPAAGTMVGKGPHTVTVTATDDAGNSSSDQVVFTVIDDTPPTISCQANIIVDFDPAVNGAVVTYTAPVGSDNCSGATTAQIAGLASGSTFPLGTTTNTFTVTDGAGLTASCSFTVTVALTSIIGLDSVTITGSAYVDSYNSAGGYPATKGSEANVLSNGTITMGNSAKVWGNVRSTRAGINMTGSSHVTGNATAGTTVSTSGSASVGGTRTNNAMGPVMTLPPVSACGPPYSPNSGISGTYTYNASTGNLTLSGTNIATLANGTYCFNNVTLGNSAQLKVNGPVVIKLTGVLNTSGSTNLNNTTQIPSNLRILSSRSGGGNGIILGNSASTYALVYAPNTGVNISGSAPLFGTAAGKTIILGGSGAIHYDTTLKTIWPDVWTLILGP